MKAMTRKTAFFLWAAGLVLGVLMCGSVACGAEAPPAPKVKELPLSYEHPAQNIPSYEQWIGQMWVKYRSLSPAPQDGWKQKHDDSHYRQALKP